MTTIKSLILFASFAVAYSLNAADPSIKLNESPLENNVISAFNSRKILADNEEQPKPAVAPLNLYYLPAVGMIYTKTAPTLKLLKAPNTEYKLTPLTDNLTKQERSLVVHMSDKTVPDGNRYRLSFNFAVAEGTATWSLDSIECQDVKTSSSKKELLTPNTKIATSLGFSFHTPSKVVLKSENYELTFDSLQVEYFNNKEHPMKFSVADDTVYFFTIPILSGIFVTSLLVTIVLIGLSMIFDIKTMDLFDDPKGKTVTINASE